MPADCRRDMDKIALEFGRGIVKYVFILSGKMSKKKIMEEWKKAVLETHPVLIIATKLLFVSAQAGFWRHYNGQGKFFGLQKSKNPTLTPENQPR